MEKHVQTGNAEVIKAVDGQGRITLPKALREYLGIFENDKFEFIIEGGRIILARHTPTCLACDDDTDVQRLNKTFLCGECRDAVGKTQATG